MKALLLCGLLFALPALAQNEPSLELAPLVPAKPAKKPARPPPAKKPVQKAEKKPGAPKAPWLKGARKAPPEQQSQALERDPGAPFVAAPPPALPLPEKAAPDKPAEAAKAALGKSAPAQPEKSAPAAPAQAGKAAPAQAEKSAPAAPAPAEKSPPAAPPAVAVPELALPPLVPLGPVEPAPPLLKLSNDVGILVQADALDAPALSRLEEGLRALAKQAPLTRNTPAISRPAKPCADDACLASLPGAAALDQLLSASLEKGVLKLRLIDVPGKKAASSNEQGGVSKDPAEVIASAEALACRLLAISGGCSGEVTVQAGPGVQLRLDGAPLAPGEKAKASVGLHQLEARAGGKTAQRVLPVSREGAPAFTARVAEGELRILAPGETAPRAAPVAAVVATSAPATERHWTKRVGIVGLVLGGAAVATAGFFGAKSKSNLDQAELAFKSNGGAYRSGDLSALHDGNSQAKTANALFVAGGILAAAGLLFTVAF